MVRPRNVLIVLAVYLALQNIVQRQLLILVFLCFWRIQLLEMEVFLTVNHRNAIRRRCRFQPYWVLPRPAESWFESHFNQRIIPESFFLLPNETETKHISSPLGNFAPISSTGKTSKKVSVHARCLGALF